MIKIGVVVHKLCIVVILTATGLIIGLKSIGILIQIQSLITDISDYSSE